MAGRDPVRATPVGPIEARIGISFTRDGKVRSLEPAKPTAVPTRAGEMTAYDPDAVGINGDVNSLIFDEEGKVSQVITTLTKLTVVHPDGHTHCHVPENRESLCSEAEQEVVPMTVTFTKDTVSVSTEPGRRAPDPAQGRTRLLCRALPAAVGQPLCGAALLGLAGAIPAPAAS